MSNSPYTRDELENRLRNGSSRPATSSAHVVLSAEDEKMIQAYGLDRETFIAERQREFERQRAARGE